MVQFQKGKAAEAMKDVNLLVYDYGSHSKNGAYLDVQIDARDKSVKGGGALEPHPNASLQLVNLKSHFKDNEGNIKEAYKTKEHYTNNQFDKIKEAAGDKVQKGIALPNGKTVDVYGIKATLQVSETTVNKADMSKEKQSMLAINTAKPMTKSEFHVGPKIREGQFDKMMEIKDIVKGNFEAQKADKAAQKDAPEKAAEATKSDKPKAVENDGPDV